MTLEEFDADFTGALMVRLQVSDLQEARKKLLDPITRTWHPSGGGRMARPEKGNIVPLRIPQAVQDFRFLLRRYDIPTNEGMEVALTEALASAMLVLQQDNSLLETIAKAYDNNPNYRHEVGKIVGVRDFALSSQFQFEH